jgi:hypothetical protein
MKTISLFILPLYLTFISCSNDNSNSQEIDSKNLEKMYDEILVLSNSKQCENSTEWRFTAIGSKACGGPTGYIVYSQKINTSAFLDKVEKYTAAERTFNSKWSITSTCDVPPEPLNISCIEGKAKLVY